FFFSSRRRHTRFSRDWSSDVCSSDLHYRQRIKMGQPFSSQMQSQRGDRMSLRGSLGRTARLTVVRKAPFGWFLTGAKEEVLLHRSEEHTSELQSRENLVCRLLLEKKK